MRTGHLQPSPWSRPCDRFASRPPRHSSRCAAPTARSEGVAPCVPLRWPGAQIGGRMEPSQAPVTSLSLDERIAHAMQLLPGLRTLTPEQQLECARHLRALSNIAEGLARRAEREAREFARD